jgi:hypothetical protein
MKPALTKKTSSRLMGGPSMGGASTPFQELSINTPKLQPQATPVTSFAQASKPNAPGAPVLSKPQLTPEPAEITNLERLANDLGSLNQNLKQFGSAAIQFAGVRDTERREDAKALSRVSYGQFPGQSLLDYRDKVEKRVKSHPEDTEAKAMLDYIQSLNPVTLKYAEQYHQAAQLRNKFDTIESTYNKTSSIGEVAIETLSVNSPEFQQWKGETLAVNIEDAKIRKEIEPYQLDAHQKLNRAQAAKNSDYKFRQYRQKTETLLATNFKSNETQPEDLAASFTGTLTEYRKIAGVEKYQEFVKTIPNQLAVAAVDAGRMYILDNGQRISASEPIPEGRTVASETIDATTSRLYLQKALETYELIQAGPNGELLSTRLDPGARENLELEILKVQADIKNKYTNYNKDLGEQSATRHSATAGLNDSKTYDDIETSNAALRRAVDGVTSDPTLRGNQAAINKGIKSVSDLHKTNTAIYSAPQQKVFQDRAQEIVDDPYLTSTEKRLGIQNLVQQGLSNRNAGPFYGSINKQRSEYDATEGYDKLARERLTAKDGLQSRLMKAIATRDGNSNPDQLTSKQNDEYSDMIVALTNKRQANRRRVFTQERPEGLSDNEWLAQQADEYRTSDRNIITKFQEEVEATEAAYAQAQAKKIQITNLDTVFSTDRRGKSKITLVTKKKWKNSVGNTAILSTEEFEKHFTDFWKTGSLSKEMIQLFKAIGYNKKKGELVTDFFRKQYSVHYPNRVIKAGGKIDTALKFLEKKNLQSGRNIFKRQGRLDTPRTVTSS